MIHLLAATITDQTGISVGVILSAVAIFGVAILTCVFWTAATLTRIDSRITRFEDIVHDIWTLENQRLWATQLNRDNKDLIVPDVDAIKGRK